MLGFFPPFPSSYCHGMTSTEVCIIKISAKSLWSKIHDDSDIEQYGQSITISHINSMKYDPTKKPIFFSKKYRSVLLQRAKDIDDVIEKKLKDTVIYNQPFVYQKIMMGVFPPPCQKKVYQKPYGQQEESRHALSCFTTFNFDQLSNNRKLSF